MAVAAHREMAQGGGAMKQRAATLLWLCGIYAIVRNVSERGACEVLRFTTTLFAAATCREAHWSALEVAASHEKKNDEATMLQRASGRII